MLENFYRAIFKWISNRKLLYWYFNGSLKRNFPFSKRIRNLRARFIIDGNTLDDLIESGKELNTRGIGLIADLLGEDVTDHETVNEFVRAYKSILRRMSQENVKGYVSLKGTMIGQAINYDGRSYNVNLNTINNHQDSPIELFYNNMEEILKESKGIFIRMDAEHLELLPSYYTVYRRLREAGYDNLGVVVQANVRRSEQYIEELADLIPDIRLVKGAYSLPIEYGFSRFSEVNMHYRYLIKFCLAQGVNLKVGTHDPKMVEFAKGQGVRNFEFLKGIAEDLKLGMAREKRLAISDYGPIDLHVAGRSYWFPYFTRRLGEHPANLKFLLRHL